MGVSLRPVGPIASLLLAYLTAISKEYFVEVIIIDAIHSLPESNLSATFKNLSLLL